MAIPCDTVAAMSTTTPAETVRISLPAHIVDLYEEQARIRGGQPVEWIMAERLRQFAEVPASAPLVIDDTQRRAMEQALGRNFQTSAALTAAVVRSATVRVDGIEIPVSPMLLEKLKSRCIGMDFDKFIQQTVRRGLEEFTGMR